MRHMSRSEPAFSPVHAAALTWVMWDSDVVVHAWRAELERCFLGASDLQTYSPWINLYTTLFKSLRLGPSKQHAAAEAIGSVIDHMLPDLGTRMLALTSTFTRDWQHLWKGKSAASLIESGVGKGHGGSMLHAWLRLQLILCRSWALLWVDMISRDTKRDACVIASGALSSFVDSFRLQCNINAESPMMEEVLDACGLNLEGEQRYVKDVPAGHARWERFALLHLPGRTLPNCSHWGCMNLTGSSDAALPTQLCSGCRRVRYCSAWCQRAAWVEGGHSMTCRHI